MILTGRTGMIALICVLPIAFSPWPAIAFVVLLAGLMAVVALDVALAASTRRLICTRSGETAARLGQPVDAVLLLENAGKRRLRGQIRDAWAPSARAEPRTHPVNIAAGQRVRLTTQRGRFAAVISAQTSSPPVRSGRWGWQAGRVHIGCRGRSASCRRCFRESTCRRGWRNCVNSKA